MRGDFMTNRVNEWIKKAMVRLRNSFANCCLYCGGEEKLEFAHVNPTDLKGWGRGRKERYYDIVKHPDDYVLFCKGCHRDYDNGMFEITPVLLCST